MKVIDPGHFYDLNVLDLPDEEKGRDRVLSLCFVKRHDPDNPDRFPGNTESYPGTTCQSVLRALLNRVRYLQGQQWCLENVVTIFALKLANWLFEFRAARRHKMFYKHGLTFAEMEPMCKECGHTICEHKEKV